MASKMDFASLLAGDTGAARERRRMRRGEVVEGTVVQIGDDSVFVDVGSTVEARMDRAQLQARDGSLTVAVGDRIRGTVANVSEDGLELVTSLARAQVDLSALRDAMEAGLPVDGEVTRAVKGGVEAQIGGARAFCPASQLSLGYVADLETFVGQQLQFLITEMRDEGRSIVLTRKPLLAAQRADQQRERLSELAVGSDHDGTVTSVKKYGAFVDVGGVEGLVHVSELAQARVERVEDVLSVGDEVRVRILALEPSEDGSMRVRLSIKALQASTGADEPKPQEVLDGTVEKHLDGGLIVATAKGSGFVPKRELGMHHGMDMRRSFPAGKQVRVVLLANDKRSGRLSFSIRAVAQVEERQNYADFVGYRSGSARGGSGLGSFGDLFAARLGVEPSEEPDSVRAPVVPEPTPTAAKSLPERGLLQSGETAPQDVPATPRVTPPAPAVKQAIKTKPPATLSRVGVVRGRKKDR